MSKETAFKQAMEGRLFGIEETMDAAYWFNTGYDAASSKLERYQISDQIRGENIETLRAENAKLIAERDEAMARFKNFHRLLCERFGVYHDEADWIRDQASLIESVATSFSLMQNEVNSLVAEREQWMKQEPVAYRSIKPEDKTT